MIVVLLLIAVRDTKVKPRLILSYGGRPDQIHIASNRFGRDAGSSSIPGLHWTIAAATAAQMASILIS